MSKEYNNRWEKPIVNPGFTIVDGTKVPISVDGATIQLPPAKVPDSLLKAFEDMIADLDKHTHGTGYNSGRSPAIVLTEPLKLEDILTGPVLTDNHRPRCECGGHKTGGTHSHWCPVRID